MASLPQVGAQAVILGMTAFNNNARTVNSQLAAMGRAAQGMERAASGSFSGAEAGMSGLAGGIAGAAATIIGALAAMGAGAVALGTRYNQQMTFIGAVSQGTSEQVLALGDAQLELSRHSTEAATNLADASTELVKAGFAISQVTGETLQAINDMIVASNGELKAADAAVLAQVAVAGFHTTVVEAANAATAAVQKSTLSFTDFAVAMRQGGAVAAKQGLSIQEFSAVIGVLGLTIKSGSEVGTGLRMMFQRLQDPTSENIELMKKYGISLYDAQGNARPFFDVLVGLQDAFGPAAIAAGKLTQAQRDQALASLFGGRAVKTVSSLIDAGTDSYLEMLDATKQLTASGLAHDLLQTTAAQAKIASNNVTALGTAFGEGLDPYINTVTKSVVKFLQSFNISTFKSVADAVGGWLYNAFSNIGTVLQQQLGPSLDHMRGALGRLGEALQPLAPVLDGLARVTLVLIQLLGQKFASDIERVAGQIDLLASGATTLDKVLGSNASTLQNFVSELGKDATAALDAIIGGLQAASDAVRRFFDWLGSSPQITAIVTGALMTILVTMNVIGKAFDVLGHFVIDMLVSIAKNAISTANNFVEAASVIVKSWIDGAASAIGKAIDFILSAFQQAVSGMNIVGHSAGQMGVSWSNAWSGIAGVVGQAVNWILSRINDMLNSLAGVPVIGEAIGAARAAVNGFLTAVPKFTAPATNALGGFVDNAIAGLTALRNFKLPNVQDFVGPLKAAYKEAADAADAAKKKIGGVGLPDTGTEPGSYPGGDGDSAAKKAQKALEDGIEKAGEVIRDFNDDVRKEVEKTAEAIAGLYSKAFDDMAEAVADYDKEVADAVKDAEKKVAELDTDRAIRDDADRRRKDLEDSLDTEDKIRQRALDEEEVSRKRALEDTEADLEKGYRAQEKAFDEHLAADKRKRDIARENEDTDFKRGQAAEARHFQDEQQRVEDNLQHIQDIEEAALKNRLDAEKEALKASQDAREKALEERLDAEKYAWQQQQDLDEINKQQAVDTAKAQAEFQADLSNGVKRSIAQARLSEKTANVNKEAEEARQRLEISKQEHDQELLFDQTQNQQRAALEAQFKQEELTQEQEHDKQLLALRAAHEAALAQLHYDQRNAQVAFDIEQENAATERNRRRAEEDRTFTEQQEKDKSLFLDRQQQRRLINEREREDYQRWLTRKAEDDEDTYRKDQERRRAELEKTLDQEEYDRRITNINSERDERLRVADDTLGKEQEKIRNRLAQDIIDLRGNMQQRLDTINDNYLDRLDDIVRDAGVKLQPVVDQITDHISTKLGDIKQAAVDATSALAEAFKAAENLASAQSKANTSKAATQSVADAIRPGGKPGESPQEVYNFGKNMGMSDADAKKLAGLQYGGVVPGPWGSPQLVLAHGGEQFDGVGGYASSLAAVRAAESMMARGIGGSTITNNYEYNVDANYGQVQPYGALVRDLSALVALTKR